MRVFRMFRVLFSSHSERNEQLSRRLEAAYAANAEATTRLKETIDGMLRKNDELTGRTHNAESS